MDTNTDTNTNNQNLSNNISFFLEEKENTSINDYQIQEMLNDFEKEELPQIQSDNNECNFSYLMDKEFYGNDELYYNHECTIKDLLKICKYYGIDKNIKASKCKKKDIISTIVYFESLTDNYNIVQRRHIMWAYITELMNDNKMKHYLLWN